MNFHIFNLVLFFFFFFNLQSPMLILVFSDSFSDFKNFSEVFSDFLPTINSKKSNIEALVILCLLIYTNHL